MEHFSVFIGIYAGIKIFNSVFEVPLLRKNFSTSSLFQFPQFLHFTLSFAFIVIPENFYIFPKENSYNKSLKNLNLLVSHNKFEMRHNLKKLLINASKMLFAY